MVQVRGASLDRTYVDAQATELGLTDDIIRLFEDAARTGG